ncbi:putative cytochrome b5 family protein [Lyophyllum shimeji]|uniref:Cytochrome b5 family protein n=1 Tax=Lyophyllum shimeji TaxID=47721 RepID=A0A9P3PS10_LYOSH|nr:putative cytochrome b5 family protein [Lyophyllum shimeji]
MTSYLRSWLTGAPVTEAKPDPSIPTFNRVSPPPEDDEGSDTATEGDDDRPPAFPSLLSAQRVQSAPRTLTDSPLMPPPALPSAQRTPGADLTARSSNASSSLSVLETTKRPAKPSRKREKVALAPGHSPLDWANLKTSGKDLRGVDTLMRIPPSVLKRHNKRDDAWSAFYGKVYNITPYLAFHPGGERELMRVAGRDGTKLFASTHAWVNADFMLDACLVGFLVPEPSS